MSEMYDALAPFYDQLNSEIDYENWADNTVKTISQFANRQVKCIADIGCGTGSMTIPLAKRGYKVYGIDLSAEMLNEAYQRALAEGCLTNIQFLMQDMTDFELTAPVDAVICTLDGINHLPNRTMLLKCFQSVSKWLAPGGIFIFDLNSLYKFEHVYGDEVYTMQTDNAFCIWQNDYHTASRFCDFWITLFEKQNDGSYLRSDSVQREQYYSRKTVENALLNAGMTLISVCGSLDGKTVEENDERWYFVAVKGT